MHSRLLVLDIETVPDAARLPADRDPAQFPKPLFHQVVAISFLDALIVRERGSERFLVEECRSGGTLASPEIDLIRGFWSLFGRARPRVVSWNGRGFDLAVLKQRAFLYGLPVAAWHRAGTSKWDTYSQRYASDWHCDLMDALGDFGAAAKLGLDETARAVGLPGKFGIHGLEVEGMIRDGRLADVRDYCEVDVLNTFLLYLRWAYLTGKTGAADYDASVASLESYLEQQRDARPHLGAFLDGCRATGAHTSIIRLPEPPLPPSDGRHLESEDVLP
jgi:predicted PolB exonuclease-like 3'-5' exonuclease